MPMGTEEQIETLKDLEVKPMLKSLSKFLRELAERSKNLTVD